MSVVVRDVKENADQDFAYEVKNAGVGVGGIGENCSEE